MSSASGGVTREATLAKTGKKENECDARGNEKSTTQSVLDVSTSIALKRLQSWPAHVETGQNLLK